MDALQLLHLKIYAIRLSINSLVSKVSSKLKFCHQNSAKHQSQSTVTYGHTIAGAVAAIMRIPSKFYVLGQIGLSKQCRPRSDCF